MTRSRDFGCIAEGSIYVVRFPVCVQVMERSTGLMNQGIWMHGFPCIGVGILLMEEVG